MGGALRHAAAAATRTLSESYVARQLELSVRCPPDPFASCFLIKSETVRPIHIIGVSLDLGGNRRGVDMGPSAFRIAGLGERLTALGMTVMDEGDLVAPIPEVKAAGDPQKKYVREIARVCERLYKTSLGVIEKGAIPVVLGGDCSILLGSLLMVAAAFLPWWRVGGDLVSGVELPASGGIGLDGPGFVIFAAAIVALALLDIGFARGRWGFALDAPGIYLLLGLAAAAALVWRGWELWSVAYLPLPQTSPGLILAIVGVGLFLWGAGTGMGSRRPT